MKTSQSPDRWTVADAEDGVRLDRFLSAPERLGSRSRVRVAMDRGQVFVNDEEMSVRKAGTPLAGGDVVRLWMNRPGSAKRRGVSHAGPLQVIYEDESLIVVNKPAGLLSVPLGTRKDAASAYAHVAEHLDPRGRRKPFIVHRIDRDTSGLVVFAKSAGAQETLKNQFVRRAPERVYWALVRGRPRPVEGSWKDRLVWDSDALMQKQARDRGDAGTEAISHYRVLETFAGVSLIEVRLQTGKRNQIRIQAALRGHQLVGERQYVEGGEPEKTSPTPELGRQALHAHRLTIEHPADRRRMTFEAPLADDFSALLTRLRKGQR